MDAADSLSAVSFARKAALAAMAAVPEKDSEDGGAFGARVGKVYVTAENTTFPKGDFTGVFVSGRYDLYANDSMMSVILRALGSAGFE